MKLVHDFFHVRKLSENQTKRSSPTIEEFLFPNLSEDQKKKKVFTVINGFCPRHNLKTNKKVQTSSSAQMQNIVKSLGGDADADHTQIIAEDAFKLLGGCIPPGFRNPLCNSAYLVLRGITGATIPHN